jgi:hypothetical protein
MGTRGPAPKRENQRRRQNKPKRPVEKRPGGAAAAPELDLEEAHPLAAALFQALKNSPESAYLTSAAWQRARVSAHVLSTQLNSGRISAVLYQAIQADWKALLIDAGELRRLGIEIQRAAPVDDDEDAAVAALDDYRRSG